MPPSPDELSGCLDLLHLPAEWLWIEWSESARREEMRRVLPERLPSDGRDAERSGVLICASASGRVGSMRTFFLPAVGPREPLVAALETLLDLDGGGASGTPGTRIHHHVELPLPQFRSGDLQVFRHCTRLARFQEEADVRFGPRIECQSDLFATGAWMSSSRNWRS